MPRSLNRSLLAVLLFMLTTAFICSDRKHSNPLDPEFEGDSLLGLWKVQQVSYSLYGYTEVENYQEHPYFSEFIIIRTSTFTYATYEGEESDSYQETGDNTIRLTSIDEDGDNTYTNIQFTVSDDQLVFEWVLEDISISMTLTRYRGEYPPACWSQIPDGDDTYEPNNQPENATEIETDGSEQLHTLTEGDVDWFSFGAESGTYYTLETQGFLDTYLQLYRSNGTQQIDYDDDSGESLNASLTWQCQSGGTYYFKARGYDNDETGPYLVSVTSSNTLSKKAPQPSTKKISRPGRTFHKPVLFRKNEQEISHK